METTLYSNLTAKQEMPKTHNGNDIISGIILVLIGTVIIQALIAKNLRKKKKKEDH